MPTEVIMPKVDMDMASGRIINWHVAEGEAVTKGEPLFDIETDKAAMEVEAPADGILHHAAPEGTEVEIGKPCGWLFADGEEVGERPEAGQAENTFAGDAAAKSADSVSTDASDSVPSTSDVASVNEQIRVTPRARSLAAEFGLDLSEIQGSGPRGRLQADDVREARDASKLEQGVAAPATFTRETGPLNVSRSKGGEGIPVVLIHGFASDATSWAPVEAHIRQRPLIRVELPSHGKSPALGIDSFGDLITQVRRTFDDLGFDSAALVGHSLGAAICIALADTRERRVSSLTLIAPAGLGPEINGDVLNGICNARRPASLAPWLRKLVSDEDIISDSYVRLAMSGRSEPNLRAAQAALADVLFPDGVQAFDLRAALRRIEIPTRIIWGKRDAIIPWKHALSAPGEIALHLFDGVGHMPHIECPDAVGRILRSTV